MVTQAFLAVLTHIVTFLVGILPTWSVPDWVDSTAAAVTQWFTNAASVSYFIPLGDLVVCLSLIAAVWVTSFAIRAIRIGYSMFTGGGGAA